MIYLLAGGTHTGKTHFALDLVRQHSMLSLSINHLKMGLIRSGQTDLTPAQDDALTAYLWPVVREMVKTAVENGQDMLVEGCYIPFDWKDSFSDEYLLRIRYCCLIFSETYIKTHMETIRRFANTAEQRRDDCIAEAELLAENADALAQCRRHGCNYLLIDNDYPAAMSLADFTPADS